MQAASTPAKTDVSDPSDGATRNTGRTCPRSTAVFLEHTDPLCRSAKMSLQCSANARHKIPPDRILARSPWSDGRRRANRRCPGSPGIEEARFAGF